MEHLQGYNDAVTKLKVLLDGNHIQQQADLQRPKDSFNHGSKRWGSHEDLLHSNYTKTELRELVFHQENLIGQLEKELSFCRNQLNDTLAKVRNVALTQSKESADTIAKLQTENESLKKSIDAKCDNLKRDNVWLVNAVQGLKDETMDLQRRESEAVEQVRQSVHMAEQISMEKAQLEMELNQAKQQLERQQERMKAMLEEHFEKVDETRKIAEQRCQEEFSVIRQQAEEHASQLAQLSTDLERSHRKEQELRRQLNEEKSMSEKMHEEYDGRVGQFQLDLVQVRAAKQQLEHEMSCMRVDYEHCTSELKAYESRHRNEVDSYKTRLQRTEVILDESRTQLMQLGETKAQLERENNLLKQSSKTMTSSTVADDPATLQQLRAVVQKQRSIIDDLRLQCSDLASKLENISVSDILGNWLFKKFKSFNFFFQSSYSDQVAKLSHQLGHCMSQMQVMEGQAKQYGSMYEQCCRKIQDLEHDKIVLQEELEALRKPTKRPSTNQTQFNQYQMQKEAIVVEQNGQVTSPLSLKNRN